ncbi:MAG TPA: SDR family oxidoreductase [Pseudonocardiaceae bacterium]|jgi:NAD(P)-dependent dehydrogenase (short-subunit alcohol dehydrogenase family)|nr:SDR family oxidoreductase [Pseudonocardiaceae bacterium]
MDISTSTALVTGANRGLGRSIAAALVERGAKVYAAARKPESVDLRGVIPVALDITDQASVDAAAAATGDVNLLVNNAGFTTAAPVLTGDLAGLRQEMETNYFGTLAVTRAFVPQIEARGGGAILNVLSVLSWFSLDVAGGYAATKGAEWQLTNALRVELASRNIRVAGLHVGFMDTDMAKDITAPKTDPAIVAGLALDGIAADQYEIVADDTSRGIKSLLSGDIAQIYPQLA